MASPVSVTATPTLLAGFNRRRKNVILQNTGTQDVLVKKWPYGTAVAPVPSATNYDFILTAKPGEGNSETDILQLESISAYVGVTKTKTSEIAVFETVKVAL